MKTENFYSDILLVFPELSLIAMICVFTIFGLVYEKSKSYVKLGSVLANLASIFLALIIFSYAMSLAHLYLWPIEKEIIVSTSLLPQSLEFSRFSYFNKIVTLSIAILCMLSSKTYFKFKRFYYFEVTILILIISVAGLFLISARDLLIVYVGIELISLSLYVLISMKKNEIQAIEAGLKYFILGSVASACLVFGFGWVYYLTGTTNMLEISTMVTYFKVGETYKFNIASFFILVGLFFKLAMFPFHYWIADVYEGAPTPVVLIMSTLAKYPLVIVMIKLNFYMFILTFDSFQQIMFLSGIMTTAIGSFYAFGQRKVKRLMAYGSMVHSGLLFTNTYTGMYGGHLAAVEYSIIYMIMTVGFFNFLMSIYKGKDRKMLLNLEDYKGMARQRPILAVTFGILILSFIGIPPFFGFFAKYYALWQLTTRLPVGWTLVLAILSLVSGVYYFRFIKNMFFSFDSSKISEPYTLWTDYSGFFCYCFCIFFSVFGFFFLGILDIYLSEMILQLCTHIPL